MGVSGKPFNFSIFQLSSGDRDDVAVKAKANSRGEQKRKVF
jgi:hypothetical protein